MATAKDKRAAARAALANLDLGAAPPSPADQSPKTGPGLLLRGVSINSELEVENKDLRAKLASWEGDAHARHIDPQLIDESAYANRHSASFDGPEFAALKAEIASSAGNVQPIKVRSKADGRFEIIFGHRRARACRELGLPVLAVISEAMSDVALFVEMDRENRQRADLSPWEQGVMYERALTKGLFPSQRKLAEALGIDLSNAGKCMALARLPESVVGAFKTPLEIQLRWGGKLAKAYESDPDGLIKRAKAIAKLEPRPKASEVFARLIGGVGEGSGSEPPPASKASVQVKPDGSALVKLPPGSVSEADLESIQRLVDDWLKSKSK